MRKERPSGASEVDARDLKVARDDDDKRVLTIGWGRPEGPRDHGRARYRRQRRRGSGEEVREVRRLTDGEAGRRAGGNGEDERRNEGRRHTGPQPHSLLLPSVEQRWLAAHPSELFAR